VKDLVLSALRESVKRYPELFDRLDGEAAWVIIRDDLARWQELATARLLTGEPAVCDYPSGVIPDSIADIVKSSLSYATSAHLIATVFADVENFMKAPGSKDKHKKIPPYTGSEPFVPTEFEDFTEAEKSDFSSWDNIMPDYAGMLDAIHKLETDEEE
jgi:hypothetical protein